MSTTRVTPETISSAVSALLKWKEAQSGSEKAQLLPQEEFFYLVLTLQHIPQKGCRVNPYKIPLPHPLVQDSEICLIIDDRPNSKLTSKDAKKKVQNDGINVSKVLKFSKLKSDYKPFEAKRKLCESYDMFFAAKGVIPLLPRLLGKTFFKKKKLPIPIDLSHKNWKEQIERAGSSGLFYIKPGTCSVVKVGRVSMEENEVVENVVEGINGIIEFVPKGWEGVRSFHLRLSGSPVLPLYAALPEVKLKIEGVREVVEAENESGVEVNESKKKDGKLGKNKKKKKGRIHEVKYMDVSSAGEDEAEGEKENDTVEDESELVGKKRKKGDSGKGKALGEEKLGKKTKKVGRGGKVSASEENVSEEMDDKEELVNKEVEVKKKKKKADAGKGHVTADKNLEKPAKKTKKKSDGDEQEKIHLPVKSTGDSAEKKGKKKSGLGTTAKNSEKKAKISKKK